MLIILKHSYLIQIYAALTMTATLGQSRIEFYGYETGNLLTSVLPKWTYLSDIILVSYKEQWKHAYFI